MSIHKKISLILVSISVFGLLTVYFWNAYELISESYYVDETKLYKVDTFHLLGRAFNVLDGAQSRGSYNLQIVFESSNRYSFAIDGNIFEAVEDIKMLEDTLMYHDIKFSVFTDKEHYDKYVRSKKPIFIRVYQIQIGDKKYVDIAKMNKISKGEKKRGVIIPPTLLFFFGFLIFKKPDLWTARHIVVWCIMFSLTLIGLLLLT